MNKLLVLVFCISLLNASCSDNSEPDVEPSANIAADSSTLLGGGTGGPIPMSDVRLKDISGKSITLSEAARENGLLVMFSCNTCPYVVKNQKRTLAIGEFAQKMGVGVILLNSNEGQRSDEDSFEEMQRYAKEQKYNFIYAVDKDHEIADAFGAKRTPECYLFDKNQKLVYHGAIDDNPSDEDAVSKFHLRNAIEAMASGKEVTIKETKSVGCSIKRN